MTQQFEVIQVTSREVACDGGGGALGHPKVYLHIDADKDNKVVCPYCSRTYLYREAA
jgi:uncharacterized Zn-finger protein